MTQIYEVRSDIWGAPYSRNFAAQNHLISARFRTTSRLDRKYLRNAARHRQSENGVANYGHSRAGKLNSVYFSPQTAKNSSGVLTHPSATVQRTGVNKSVAIARGQHAYRTSGHHAAHWHASSSNCILTGSDLIIDDSGQVGTVGRFEEVDDLSYTPV